MGQEFVGSPQGRGYGTAMFFVVVARLGGRPCSV